MVECYSNNSKKRKPRANTQMLKINDVYIEYYKESAATTTTTDANANKNGFVNKKYENQKCQNKKLYILYINRVELKRLVAHIIHSFIYLKNTTKSTTATTTKNDNNK